MLKENKLVQFFSKNKLYIFLAFLFITPLLSSIYHIFIDYNYFVYYIPNMIMIYVGLYALFFNKLEKKEKIFISVMLLLMIISCLLSKYKMEAFFGCDYRLEGLITYISYIGYFYCGTRLKDNKKLELVLNILIGTGIILSILMFIKSPFILNMFDIKLDEYYQYSGPFAHYNHMGYYLLIVNICSLFMYFIKENKTKFIYLLTSAFLLYALIINNTFGAFLSYIFILLSMFIYFFIKKNKLKDVFIYLIVFILICFISTRNNENLVYENFNELFSDTSTIVNSETEEEIYNVGTKRGILWVYALKFIKDKPIFGYGLENTQYEYYKNGIEDSKSHNLILEQATNCGIPFMIMYFIFIITLVYKNIKCKKLSNISLMSLFIVIGFIINLMFGNSTFYVSPYFYLFLGVLGQNYYKKQKIRF